MDNKVTQNTAGASNAPNRIEQVGKWSNTSNPLDIVNFNASSDTFASGSEVVVLGWDPADTDTSGFWEELFSGNSGGSQTSWDTGSFTAKKYLCIQYRGYNSIAANQGFQFNSDTASNYSVRGSGNGGADVTATSDSKIQTSYTGYSTPQFFNIFIVNNSANEKLVIGWMIDQSTAGAGTAPNRFEFVGKWSNTSNQITSIQLKPSSASLTITDFKVWGAN